MGPVLESNTNAQRLPLQSHLLRSAWLLLVQIVGASRAVSNKESRADKIVGWCLGHRAVCGFVLLNQCWGPGIVTVSVFGFRFVMPPHR